MAQHFMVIGPSVEAADVVAALAERGIEGWSDRLGRVALDFVSFDWADALVVIDPTFHAETQHVRPIVDFPGPKLLAIRSVEPGRRAALLDQGFDVVLDWPSPTRLIAAYADRFLSRSVLSRSARLNVS